VNQLLKSTEPVSAAPIATGVPGLDAVLAGGFFPGSVILVAGPPGTGKTTLGNQIAYSPACARSGSSTRC